MLAIVIYIFVGMKVTNINTNQKVFYAENDIEKYANVNINTYVVDFGDEKKYLSGVRYKISTYNEIYSAYSNENLENQNYYMEFHSEGENVFQEAYNILSKEQKEVIESIQSTNGFFKINKGNYLQCSWRENQKFYCNIKLPSIVYIEETRVPSGYTKNKVMTPSIITLTYEIKDYPKKEISAGANSVSSYFGEKQYNIDLQRIQVNNVHGYHMEFGNVDRLELVGVDIEKSWELWKKYADSASTIPDTPYQDGNHTIYLQSIKKNINLEIDNYVINKTTTTTTKNTNVEYKVSVRNVGNKDAVDTIITSKLPLGFEYVEGTASNGGEYVDGQIEWRTDRIDSGKDLVLTYNAYAPENIDISKEYIGEANISNFALSQDVIAKTTTTKLSMINPKTRNSILIASTIVILIIISMAVMIIHKRREEYDKEIEDY